MKREILEQKIKSSSLIEVIVAMLISSIVFSFAFSIIINVTSVSAMTSNSYYNLAALGFMEKIKSEPEQVLLQEEKWQDITIYKTISDYNEIHGLNIIEVRVFDAAGKERAVSCLLSRFQNKSDK